MLLLISAFLAVVLLLSLIAAGLRLLDGPGAPDPVINVARCVACNQPTFQSVAADINRTPPLCSHCQTADEETP